ncbi:hypothetical protein V8E53_011735 [Lactarius tabidus]
MRQDLYDFVQHSSERLKLCEADVLQYHQQFLVLSNPLVRAHYLTVEERDTEFWYGFHPDDHAELYPHLCRAVPRWPRDTPFDINDVFANAREIFMIELPWLQKSHFEAPNAEHEPANIFEPVSVLTSLPPITPPLHAVTPHPSPEHPPEIRRPASAPPVTQHFNDLGEGNPCPQVDLGFLPGTCHGSDAHETPCSSHLSPVSFSPSPSLTHLLSSPRSSSPSPFPQSPICLSSPPCDLSHTLSPSRLSPVHAMSSPSPSPFDSQTTSQLIPSPSPALPTSSSSLHDSILIPSPSPLLSSLAPSPSPLSAPDILPVVLSPLDPVPTRPQPLPPDSSPMLSPSPSPVHATTSSPPLPPSSQLASRSQLLDGSRMSPRDSPLPLAFPPSPPPRPPDPMPVRSVEPQLPPPAPSLLSAFPSQPFDRTPTPRQKRSLRFPPPRTSHIRLIPPLLPPLRPPDPAPVMSAEPQPPPPSPPFSSPTEATNVVAMHHEAHRSKQPTDTFEPQNRSHTQCRRYHQRLQQCDFQYRYPLTSPQARRPRHLPRHPHDSRLTSIPHIAVGVSWTNELDISKAEKQADRGWSDFRPPSRCKAHDLSELVDYILHY